LRLVVGQNRGRGIRGKGEISPRGGGIRRTEVPEDYRKGWADNGQEEGRWLPNFRLAVTRLGSREYNLKLKGNIEALPATSSLMEIKGRKEEAYKGRELNCSVGEVSLSKDHKSKGK